MTPEHTAMHDSGLLGGALDAPTRAEWPDWARAHVDECDTCRRIVAVESLVAGLGRPTPPPPSLEALRRRLAQIQPVDPARFLEEGARQTRRYRGEATGALELSRTATGVRAVDPDARELVLFAISRGSPPRVVVRRDSPTPGIGLETAIAPTTPTSVVALSTDGRFDLVSWSLWLSDVFRAGTPPAIPLGDAAGRVRAAFLHLRPPTTGDLLKVGTAALPDPLPAVTELLKGAAAAGRKGDMEAACREYRRAQERAFGLQDASGEIRAGVGLALALLGLGYEDDAEQVVAEVAARHVLDARWADFVCRTLAWRALAHGDPDGADGWLAEGERTGAADTGWRHVLRVTSALARRDYAAALALLDGPQEGAATPISQDVMTRKRAAALAGAGRVAEARAILATLGGDQTIEDLLWRLVAGELAGPRRDGARPDEQLAEFLARHPDSQVSTWQVAPLHALVDGALERGAPAEAATLMRLRFLPPEEAVDPEIRALVAASDRDAILLTDPSDARRASRLPVRQKDMLRLTAVALEEALTEASAPSALPALRALLFPRRPSTRDEIVVASDGVLADVPLQVLLAEAAVDAPLVAWRFATVRVAARARSTDAIASLADAWGDLPFAGREVEATEAEIRLRGNAVTRAALAQLPPVGLLHVGVHARREQGLPVLMLADGPMGPAEIGNLRIAGAPVVLLSGCATATRPKGRGVERSLADAFLRAGASAVVATRWPIDDREAHDLVRALLERWPFDDPARAVAHVCSNARSRGAPARFWSALTLYQPAAVPTPGGPA